ncbi:hypothetical protein Fmac_011617 [Flemingia macrophylla]|uniref:GH3 C-terminal domain-containing protein n=1 Tax=Flemingia macrophylla TaxID=520843 RepID=A0ABD1MNB1_9FABA
MDKSFTDHSDMVSTKTNSIGPLELYVLEGGTFKKILDTFIANGATLSQLKTPKFTNNHILLKILNNSTTRKTVALTAQFRSDNSYPSTEEFESIFTQAKSEVASSTRGSKSSPMDPVQEEILHNQS